MCCVKIKKNRGSNHPAAIFSYNIILNGNGLCMSSSSSLQNRIKKKKKRQTEKKKIKTALPSILMPMLFLSIHDGLMFRSR